MTIRNDIICLLRRVLAVYFLGSFLLVAMLTAQELPDKQDIVLENEHVRLVFADSTSFLMKEYKANGYNILSDNNVSPWQFTYLGDNGENPVLTPKIGIYKGSSVKKTGNSQIATFTWDILLKDGLFPVDMMVTLDEDSELPEWRIYAKLPEDWVVTKLEFPRISFKQPKGSKAILSAGYGVEYTLGSQGTLQSRYPSSTGTMQLVIMHNDDGAVYYSTKDVEASDKIFKISSSGNTASIFSEITASYGWTKNGEFELPWATVVGFCEDGWMEACDRWYRPFTFTTEWGAKKIGERTNIAEWVKNADLWLRPMGADKEIYDALNKALDYFGNGIGLHWYYWHNYPFDTKYPEYFPYKEGFDKMVEEVEKKGNYVTPYINGRLWDTNTESYVKLNGKDASCRKPDGTLYTEIYGSKVLNSVTCPSSDIWNEVQKDLIKKILYDIKTSGVYIDQIGAAPSEPCYATNHSHSLGGGSWWHYAYRKMINEAREEFMTKEQALTTEENAECYIDMFDMMLIVNTPHSLWQKIVPLFPMIYSDRAVYSGYTYIPFTFGNGELNYLTMKSLLWGSQLGWVDVKTIVRTDLSKEAKFLKDLAEFRKNNHDLFLGGRFVREIIPEGDNPKVLIPKYEETNVVLAAEWKSVDGERCYVVVNMDDKPHKVSLPNNKSVEIDSLSCMRIII